MTNADLGYTPFKVGDCVSVYGRPAKVVKLRRGGALQAETSDGRLWLLSGFGVGVNGEPCYSSPEVSS